MSERPKVHPFLDSPYPLAFAHRGGTETGHENTLGAFAAAVELGFEYLETDVHLTADGVVVAAHDERLDRVADVGGAIAEMDWREVSAARIGGVERIPTMEELFETFPASRFNIDPKSHEVVEPLLDLIVRHDAIDRVCIGTFSDKRLATARARLGRELCTAAGPRETAKFMASARLRRHAGDPTEVAFDCLQVPVTHKGIPIVNRLLVEHAARVGVQVHVWTIDEPAEMNRLLDLGVDGLMTDCPSILRAVLEERGQWAAMGP